MRRRCSHLECSFWSHRRGLREGGRGPAVYSLVGKREEGGGARGAYANSADVKDASFYDHYDVQ